MKRSIAVMVVLAVAGVAGAVTYQAAARDRDYRALLARGDSALRDEQTFGAIEAFSGAIALRPDSMLAHLRRGETYQRRGDLEAAARDFRMAAALDPTATRPLDELGDVMYQLQRFQRAGEIYESCLKLDADTYYLLGLCLRGKRRYLDAEQALERAIALSPGLIAARDELADLYGSLGRRADELEQLQVLAGLDREHVERQVAVGLAHARAGHADLAVLTLGNALERTPDQPSIYAALGRVWLDIAQTRSDRVALGKALEALEHVASSPASTSEILTLYGRALLQDGQSEAAERTLEEATRRYPIDPSAYLYYSTAAEQRNHLVEARQALGDYGALVAGDVDLVPRAMRIASLSLRLKDVAAGVGWLKRAAAASPNDVRVLAALADAQMRAGDRDAARATIARGLEGDPANAALLALARRLR